MRVIREYAQFWHTLLRFCAPELHFEQTLYVFCAAGRKMCGGCIQNGALERKMCGGYGKIDQEGSTGEPRSQNGAILELNT